MEDFRRQFLIEAAENLRALIENFQAATISDSVKRDAFRTLHTIKGTAQTFGVNSASRLAHELETLLSTTKTFVAAESKSFFLEGIELLIESLEKENFKIPHLFAEKIHNLIPTKAQSSSDDFSSGVPDELFLQLTAQEKNAVHSAKENQKILFCFEVGYALATFADELINFRELLDESGEIIATLPGAKSGSGDGRIGFRILYASRAEASKISAISQAGAAKIIFDSSSDNFSTDAAGVLAHIVRHGKTTARRLGKRIEFEISAAESNLPPDKLKTVFDIALHLVRNAVDHAVETVGKIEIDLKNEKDGWRLTVADDGRGIDLEKIRAKAIKENLIADYSLTERETMDLIFLPDFSTKSNVSETSGRGVGLEAVKSAVEKVGGSIDVKSRRGRGTTFEIFLPQ